MVFYPCIGSNRWFIWGVNEASKWNCAVTVSPPTTTSFIFYFFASVPGCCEPGRLLFDSRYHCSKCHPHWSLRRCMQSEKVILLESLGSDWITSQWFALSYFWKDEFLSQSQRVHARIIAPAHTNLPRTNDFAWECNFCATFQRFNQRYYANLPFLSSFSYPSVMNVLLPDDVCL